MRRLISRLVLIVAVLIGVLSLGANSAISSHQTADIWPNAQTVGDSTLDVSFIGESTA